MNFIVVRPLLFAIFLETWPKDLGRIHAALAKGDAASVERIAHILKAYLETFAAKPAAQLAANIEEAGRQGLLYDLAKSLASLQTELKALSRHLEKLVSDGRP